MEKFVEFWAGIWEKDEITPEKPWRQKVKLALQEKVPDVKENKVRLDRGRTGQLQP